MTTSWTVAASTGTADESSREFLVFGRRPPAPVLAPSTPSAPSFSSSKLFGTEDSVVSVRFNAPKRAFNVRYHMPLEPIETQDFEVLEARYLVDDKQKSQVVVLLKKFSLISPNPVEEAEILAVLDSQDHQASDNFQIQSVQFNDHMDDEDFCYFAEALLINNNDLSFGQPLPGSPLKGPAIAAIRISSRIT